MSKTKCKVKVRIPADLPIAKGLEGAYAAAVEQHWRFMRTANSHVKWMSPNGGLVYTGGTPSSTRSIDNHISQLRRAGLVY